MRNIEWGNDYNVYCDESCHLEKDGKKAMSLGAVWCPKGKVPEINKRIQEIKEKHSIQKGAEVKWTKASPGNMQLYLDIVDYFFSYRFSVFVVGYYFHFTRFVLCIHPHQAIAVL